MEKNVSKSAMVAKEDAGCRKTSYLHMAMVAMVVVMVVMVVMVVVVMVMVVMVVVVMVTVMVNVTKPNVEFLLCILL